MIGVERANSTVARVTAVQGNGTLASRVAPGIRLLISERGVQDAIP